jgi:hypothetical protein
VPGFFEDGDCRRTTVVQRFMNSGLIAAASAILGSLVGAFGSVVGTWITQRHQDKRERLAKKIGGREALYSDFIMASTRLVVDGLEHSVGDPQILINVYALLSRIRLSSSTEVLQGAEELVRSILASYSQPNLTTEEIQSRVEQGEDPLRKFSETCRAELESLERGLQ